MTWCPWHAKTFQDKDSIWNLTITITFMKVLPSWATYSCVGILVLHLSGSQEVRGFPLNQLPAIFFAFIIIIIGISFVIFWNQSERTASEPGRSSSGWPSPPPQLSCESFPVGRESHQGWSRRCTAAADSLSCQCHWCCCCCQCCWCCCLIWLLLKLQQLCSLLTRCLELDGKLSKI